MKNEKKRRTTDNIGTMLGNITEEEICGKADLGVMIRIEDSQKLSQECNQERGKGNGKEN